MTDPGVVATYRRALARRGEPVTFRRVTGQAPNAVTFSATVQAMVADYVPQGDVMPIKREGGITQGARKIIVLAEDLALARFPVPLVKNDKVVVGDIPAALNVESVDGKKRALAGAVEVVATGV